MKFAQICDQIEIQSAAPLDSSALPGTWINSNPQTTALARLVIKEAGDDLSLEAYGVGSDGLVDWGTSQIDLFASAPFGRVAAGFTCVFDFGFKQTRLQGMIMKGLLVLAEFHSFKDKSGRSDYFLREYFALVHQRQ
jgi:hypothetical protein